MKAKLASRRPSAAWFQRRPAQSQRGYVLLMVFMFLIILGMVMAYLLTTGVAGSREAGAKSDQDLALQYAEMALRDAELNIMGLTWDGKNIYDLNGMPKLEQIKNAYGVILKVNPQYTRPYDCESLWNNLFAWPKHFPQTHIDPPPPNATGGDKGALDYYGNKPFKSCSFDLRVGGPNTLLWSQALQKMPHWDDTGVWNTGAIPRPNHYELMTMAKNTAFPPTAAPNESKVLELEDNGFYIADDGEPGKNGRESDPRMGTSYNFQNTAYSKLLKCSKDSGKEIWYFMNWGAVKPNLGSAAQCDGAPYKTAQYGDFTGAPWDDGLGIPKPLYYIEMIPPGEAGTERPATKAEEDEANGLVQGVDGALAIKQGVWTLKEGQPSLRGTTLFRITAMGFGKGQTTKGEQVHAMVQEVVSL